MNKKIYFAGEHNSPLHPRVIEALIRVNTGKEASYREDSETRKMQENFNSVLNTNVKVYLLNSGTAANIMALASLTKPYNSIISPKSGHILTYEAGAPTRFTGCVIDYIPTKDGKLDISQIEIYLKKRPKENVYTQPKVVYITQPTEYGTLWTIKELKELGKFCKENDLYLSMNGVRIANACSKLGCSLKEMTVDTGVDVFSFGGVKNGGLVDALVFINQKTENNPDFILKQLGQDAAKSRYYSATINALLKDDLWLKNGEKANQMALKLYAKIKNNKHVKVVITVETNFIWSILDSRLNEKLKERFVYYDETNDLDIEEYKDLPYFTRWMFSWATTDEEINQLADAVNKFA